MIYEGFVCAGCNDFHREIKNIIYYYLSFADKINGNPVFIGGLFVEASNADEAYAKVKKLKLHSKGQILFFKLEENDKIPDKKFLNRLLPEDEVKSLIPDARRLGDFQ